MSYLSLTRLSRPWSRHTLSLLIVLAALSILAFYTVTDSNRLTNDHLLDGADYIGYAICHRITDRSFAVAGRQLPLCARCTGIYLGVSLTFIVLALAGRRRWSDLPPFKVMLVLIGFVVVMGIDGINSYSHFFPDIPHAYEPRNWLRLVTGLGAGLAMGAIMFPALAQTIWHEQVKRPALGDFWELAGLILLAAVVAALVLSNQPTILYVLGLVSAAGVLIILTAINTTALLILTRRDARATNWLQAAIPLAIGFSFALAQVAIISIGRFALTGTMTGLPGL